MGFDTVKLLVNMEKAFKKEVLNVQVAPLYFVGEKLIFFNFTFLVFLFFFQFAKPKIHWILNV